MSVLKAPLRRVSVAPESEHGHRRRAQGCAALALLVCAGLAACSTDASQGLRGVRAHASPRPSSVGTTSNRGGPHEHSRPARLQPPSWLGHRVLPRGAGGYGLTLPTPPRLRRRAFATTDYL